MVEIEVIRSGVLPTAASWIYRPRGALRAAGPLAMVVPGQTKVPLSVLSFLLRHPEHGPVLVDTGLAQATIDDPRRDYGRVGGIVFGALEPEAPAFDVQLREHGVDPGDVRIVLMTHLHGDHTSAMRLLPRAEFVCARREWTAATSRRAAFEGYVARHLPGEERMRLLDVDGGEEVELLDGVRLVPTPGHSPGHLSVLVETPERRVLLAGDAIYTLRNLHERIAPLRVPDRERYEASVERVAALERDGALVVPSHDDEAWRAVGAGSRDP